MINSNFQLTIQPERRIEVTAANLAFFAALILFWGQFTPVMAQQAENRTKLPASSVQWPEVAWHPIWVFNRKRPGYPLLENVRHFQVQPALTSAGAYHHHPLIDFIQDQFVAIWSNHPTGEDGPGQQILGATSRDGMTWSAPQVIFGPQDQIKSSSLNGRSLLPGGFFVFESQWFVFCVVNDSVGFGKFNSPVTGQPGSEMRTKTFSKRIRKGQGYLVKPMTLSFTEEQGATMRTGQPSWVGTRLPDSIEGYPLGNQKVNDEKGTAWLKLIRDQQVPWDFNLAECEVSGRGRLLCEPTRLKTGKGLEVIYFRDLAGSQKLFAQFFTKDGQASPITETPIPDAPSKTVVGKVNDRFILIGNQVVSKRGTRRDPLTLAISKDGVSFERAYAIRWRAPKFRVPTQQQAPDGRGRGFQYPDFVSVGDDLWVIHSVNKECIEVSRVPLASILKTD